MIAFERLSMLALGELPDDEAVAVEEHVLGCAGCAAVLERLLDLGEGIAEVTRLGGAFLLVGRGVVDRLEAEGMITRRYAIVSGGAVACTVDARDLYVSMRLELETRGLSRLDLLYESPIARHRFEDVPFDPGEVVFSMPATFLRTLPTQREELRLVAVEGDGERTAAAYELHHTAFRP
jgi:hypothetical protein